MSLSEKRFCTRDHDCKIFECEFGYSEEDVIEFIRELKSCHCAEPNCIDCRCWLKKIDKLAGEKLCKR